MVVTCSSRSRGSRFADGSVPDRIGRCGAAAPIRRRSRPSTRSAFRSIAERPAFFAPYVESSAGPRAFIDAIIDDRPATPDLHDGVAAQRVIEAAIRSQAGGCRIKL
jgi:predicted dehydrogenase